MITPMALNVSANRKSNSYPTLRRPAPKAIRTMPECTALNTRATGATIGGSLFKGPVMSFRPASV